MHDVHLHRVDAPSSLLARLGLFLGYEWGAWMIPEQVFVDYRCLQVISTWDLKGHIVGIPGMHFNI